MPAMLHECYQNQLSKYNRKLSRLVSSIQVAESVFEIVPVAAHAAHHFSKSFKHLLNIFLTD